MRLAAVGIGFGLLGLAGCSSIPEPKHAKYEWPKGLAFIGDPGRPYETLGSVRARADFSNVDFGDHEEALCRNYFNKASRELVKFAKQAGGDAVIDVRSVVVLLDGKVETYPKAECSDEGAEGQVLVRGIAVRWKPEPDRNP